MPSIRFFMKMLDTFLARVRPGLDQGESRLHEEDEDAAEEDEDVVEDDLTGRHDLLDVLGGSGVGEQQRGRSDQSRSDEQLALHGELLGLTSARGCRGTTPSMTGI